ncbi:AmiS/UreI family transporter [Arthrobacter sp. NPDC092385]|uniref:AmiS/UreI family transporter n=1 Tax=Arthrobacter sp. NPDC092385 TaxID=3363943 RepID=UPI00382FE23B
MSYICLLLSGAALLINGLGLLGRVAPRDSGFFNLAIGTLQLVFALLIASAGGPGTAASAGGIVLFGLTYLYVGLSSVAGLGSAGVGWFCGFVAVLALVFAGTAADGDPVSSVLWLSWAVLWALFFLLLARGAARLTRITGWSAILVGTAGTVIPAVLGLNGAWPTGGSSVIAAAAVLGVLFVAAATLSTRPAPAVAPRTPVSA